MFFSPSIFFREETAWLMFNLPISAALFATWGATSNAFWVGQGIARFCFGRFRVENRVIWETNVLVPFQQTNHGDSIRGFSPGVFIIQPLLGSFDLNSWNMQPEDTCHWEQLIRVAFRIELDATKTLVEEKRFKVRFFVCSFFLGGQKSSGRGNCPGGAVRHFELIVHWLFLKDKSRDTLDFAILQWLKYIYCRELKRHGASVWINTVSVNHKSSRTRCLGWWQFESWDLIRFWSLPTYLEICTFAPSFPRVLVLEDQPPAKFR